MAISDMKVFNKYVQEATIESLTQQVNKFNVASNGAIVLTSEGFEGDFFERSLYAGMEAALRRVDRYASNATATPTALNQLQEDAVKVAGGFTISFEPSQMTWIGKNEAEAIEVISRRGAELILKDQFNTAIKGLVSAIGNQAGATNDVSATSGISYSALNTAHAKFGDSSMNLICQVMNGATYHKFVGLNIANSTVLFKAENVLIVEILGKPVVVTDSPDFYVAGTPNKYKVLSLVGGAVTVMDGNDYLSNFDMTNGKSRIEATYQVDYTFGLGIKGYSWDVANGGKSPTDAEIGTGSNWDLIQAIKSSAGVITIADADQ
jgi:hypothetical protein